MLHGSTRGLAIAPAGAAALAAALTLAGCTQGAEPSAQSAESANSGTAAAAGTHTLEEAAAAWTCGGLSVLKGIEFRAGSDAEQSIITPEQLQHLTQAVTDAYAYFVEHGARAELESAELGVPVAALREVASEHPDGGEAVDAAVAELSDICERMGESTTLLGRPGEGG